MKNIIFFLTLFCPILSQAQYFSGAAGFFALPDGSHAQQYYGVLGGNIFGLTLEDEGTGVVHHNNPLLYGEVSTHTLDVEGVFFDLEIGPVPADQYLRIAGKDLNDPLHFTLINNLGMVVHSVAGAPASGVLIDLSETASGIYYLRVTDRERRNIQSFPITINH